MKNAVRVLIAALLIIVVFIFFHPNNFSALNPAVGLENNSEHVIVDYCKELVSFKPVKDRIVKFINDLGIHDAFVQFGLLAPLEEELWYRGALWIICLLFTLRNPTYKTLAWITLFIPTYIWAIQHPYSPFYQSLVFLGGIINGCLIMFLAEKEEKWLKWLGLPTAFFLHSFVNCLLVYIIWRFN